LVEAVTQGTSIEEARPMTCICDNQVVFHIASNSMFHVRTKHIEIDCHFVRLMKPSCILPKISYICGKLGVLDLYVLSYLA